MTSSPLKLIIGLGNPGGKYQGNRHNVGHLFIDWLKSHPLQSEGSDSKRNFFAPDLSAKLIKTTSFMNSSGDEVKKLIASYKLPAASIIIVHDDLDIPLGKFKIQKSGGPKLHRGIASIEQSLGTKEFWRVRIGVDNRDPGERIDGETYVLADFTQHEVKSVLQVFDKVVDKLQSVFHNE